MLPPNQSSNNELAKWHNTASHSQSRFNKYTKWKWYTSYLVRGTGEVVPLHSTFLSRTRSLLWPTFDFHEYLYAARYWSVLIEMADQQSQTNLMCGIRFSANVGRKHTKRFLEFDRALYLPSKVSSKKYEPRHPIMTTRIPCYPFNMPLSTHSSWTVYIY